MMWSLSVPQPHRDSRGDHRGARHTRRGGVGQQNTTEASWHRPRLAIGLDDQMEPAVAAEFKVITPSAVRTPRAAAIAGIVFALLLGTALVLLRQAVPANP